MKTMYQNLILISENKQKKNKKKKELCSLMHNQQD